MINVMDQVEKSLDPQLWHACAGGLAEIPPINSKIYYFPQGHAESASKNVDFGGFSRISPLILCRVSDIKYLADDESDEVYARIGLVPLKGHEFNVDDDVGFMGFGKNEEREKPNSFAKTLTQSDANNGGGFSVPRYCAETIFPRLDYTAEPPVQTILAKDVHGEVWKFRHIYRGTPRRHLLTTGWSNFVNQKKLVAGDSIVFLRGENGDLYVGIRRAKVGIGGGPEVSFGSNVNCAYSSGNRYFSIGNARKGNDSCGLGVKERGNARAESVIEAANLAATGRPFEVVYYPRASTPEFVARASSVRDAMRVRWCAGMRFKMAFETEDSSRVSWFMGTVSAVQVNDPIHWPNSPWRLLQVAWDEPELLQNVKRVNPWLVELVSNIPTIHLSPFSPPRKRPRLPEPSEFSGGQLPIATLLTNPLSPSSPLCCFPDNISASIQGARHAQIGLSSSDLHFRKLQTGLHLFDFKLDPLSVSCSNQNLKKKTEAPVFLLFGQPILTEQQISLSRSMDTGGNSLSDGNKENIGNVSNGSGSSVTQNCRPDASLGEEFPKTAQCKVFVESKDVGPALDLTILGSVEKLHGKVTAM